MKKLLAVIITAFMMASGLVAFTGSAASSAGRCPYTGCIKTTTKTSGPYFVKKGRGSRVKARTTTAGNAQPTGRYVITVRKGNGKFIRKRRTSYNGGPKIVYTGKLRSKGRYKAIVKYRPGPNDPFKRSRGIKLLRVR